MNKRCSDCAYYRPKENKMSGSCRRYPPNWEGRLAEVNEHDWCGEFSAKQEHAHCDIHDAMGRAGNNPNTFKRYVYVDDGGIAM